MHSRERQKRKQFGILYLMLSKQRQHRNKKKGKLTKKELIKWKTDGRYKWTIPEIQKALKKIGDDIGEEGVVKRLNKLKQVKLDLQYYTSEVSEKSPLGMELKLKKEYGSGIRLIDYNNKGSYYLPDNWDKTRYWAALIQHFELFRYYKSDPVFSKKFDRFLHALFPLKPLKRDISLDISLTLTLHEEKSIKEELLAQSPFERDELKKRDFVEGYLMNLIGYHKKKYLHKELEDVIMLILNGTPSLFSDAGDPELQKGKKRLWEMYGNIPPGCRKNNNIKRMENELGFLCMQLIQSEESLKLYEKVLKGKNNKEKKFEETLKLRDPKKVRKTIRDYMWAMESFYNHFLEENRPMWFKRSRPYYNIPEEERIS